MLLEEKSEREKTTLIQRQSEENRLYLNFSVKRSFRVFPHLSGGIGKAHLEKNYLSLEGKIKHFQQYFGKFTIQKDLIFAKELNLHHVKFLNSVTVVGSETLIISVTKIF